MRVLIAGCGYVGGALASRLGAAGHQVWGLARTPSGLPPGTRPVPADLSDPSSLRDLPRGLDAVVYAASADGFREEAYVAAYVDGPRHLLGALADAGERPSRVIFTSSTGVYGQTGGDWVDEASRAAAEHFSGAVLRRGEEVFAEASFPTVVARLGGIYGPGRTRLVDSVRRGEATCAAGEARWTNRIHRDDAAGALAHLLARDEVDDLYLVVDREPAERCAVLRWIAARLGVAEPPVESGGDTGGSQRSNKRVSSRRLSDAGYRFTYPSYREGYGAMIADLEADGG